MERDLKMEFVFVLRMQRIRSKQQKYKEGKKTRESSTESPDSGTNRTNLLPFLYRK